MTAHFRIEITIMLLIPNASSRRDEVLRSKSLGMAKLDNSFLGWICGQVATDMYVVEYTAYTTLHSGELRHEGGETKDSSTRIEEGTAVSLAEQSNLTSLNNLIKINNRWPRLDKMICIVIACMMQSAK